MYRVNLEQMRLVEQVTTNTETETTWKDFFTREICLYTYAAFITATVVWAQLRSYLFFKFCMRASTNLHNQMFSKIVHGTMRFFNVNPSGRILNRFSKDIGAVDETLPSTVTDFVQV